MCYIQHQCDTVPHLWNPKEIVIPHLYLGCIIIEIMNSVLLNPPLWSTCTPHYEWGLSEGQWVRVGSLCDCDLARMSLEISQLYCFFFQTLDEHKLCYVIRCLHLVAFHSNPPHNPIVHIFREWPRKKQFSACSLTKNILRGWSSIAFSVCCDFTSMYITFRQPIQSSVHQCMFHSSHHTCH